MTAGAMRATLAACLVTLTTAAATAAAPGLAGAATLELVGNYDSPVYVTSHRSGANRLYIVEQPGRVKLTKPQGTRTLLDITGMVSSGGERGLLSMALAPGFTQTGRFFVFYTDTDGDLQLDRYRVNAGVVDPASRRAKLTIEHSQFSNHNGGQLQFGPDGNLYISTGDGGGSGDPGENAQDLTSLLGKVLRIKPAPSGDLPYSIPPTNPFAGTANDPAPGARDEIWSYGLRNPWRFSFDRLSGALAIGDVGQALWEEVDYVPGRNAGRAANFGWDCREGRHDFEPAGCPPLSALTEPIFEYANPPTGAAAVTGGYVVRDLSLGDLYGRYVYADTYAGEIRSLVPAVPDASDDRSEGLSVSLPVSFGEDAACGVYVVSLNGPVYRLAGTAPPSCPS